MNETDNMNSIFSQLSEDTNEIFWYTDLKGGISFFQDEIFRNSGIESDRIRNRFEDAVRKSLEKNASHPDALSNTKKNINVTLTIGNETFHYKTIIFPADSDGYISGITTNISSEAKFVRTLAKNETVYRTLLKTSPDAIVLVDSDGDIIKANEKMAEFSDQARADMIGTRFTDFISENSRENAEKLINSLKPGDVIKEHEFMFVRNNGSGFHAELTATLLSDAALNIQLYIVVIRDITRRKEAQLKGERIQRELLELFFNRLSDRELELLGYIRNGNKWPSEKRLIAKTMYVLPGTLDKFMTRIKSKLQTGDLEKIIKIYSQFTE